MNQCCTQISGDMSVHDVFRNPVDEFYADVSGKPKGLK